MIDVATVGSLHLDIMVRAPRLPASDETLMGSAWSYKCGGKGGNQAVAAASCGARTGFGGMTGRDDFGDRLRANLAAAGVDISCLGVDASRGSGMSVAIEQDDGEYGAVVVSGANLGIDAEAIAEAWIPLWQAKALLLQSEIPEVANVAAASAAAARGAKVILNAAPARGLSPQLLGLVDVLVVNRVEAAMLSGISGDEEAAIRRLAAPSRDVVLTRGGRGLLVLSRSGRLAALPALPVSLVSSHGAGDCFCGALAARLAAGDNLDEACAYAATAAGLFVSRQPSDAAINDHLIRERMNNAEQRHE